MKKLFLASVASVMMDKASELLPDKPNKLKLAFIPTAADLYTEKEWMDADRAKLVQMGFEVKNVDLKNKNRKDLEEELKGMDVIFVAGGNTFYLLEKVRESGFDRVAKKLINEGVVYIGSSAGAVLAGPTIEIINKMDDPADAPNLKSFKALNLVNFIVMPHFGDEKYKDIFDEAVKRGKDLGYEVKLLTNYQALIVNGGRVRLVSV